MARRSKQELDYFPLDVWFDQDDKIRLLETEFGNQATLVYLKLLSRIYREKGWWKKWDDDTQLLFARDIGEKANYVQEVISGCLRRGLFCQSVFELSGVLTSASIQERYIDIVNQLGRAHVVIYLEYWVYKNDLSSYNRINPDVISIKSDETRITSGRNTTKEKEKEKEIEMESARASLEPFKADKKPAPTSKAEGRRINRCPVPDSLLKAPGFIEDYQRYLEYSSETLGIDRSPLMTDSDFRRLVELQLQNHDPGKVIWQTISGGNKSFYPLKDKEFEVKKKSERELWDEEIIRRNKSYNFRN